MHEGLPEFLGMFLMAPSWTFALAIITFLVNNHFRILEEEKHLLKLCMGEYEEYCKKAGRHFMHL